MRAHYDFKESIGKYVELLLYGIAPAAGAIFRRLVRLGRSPLTRAMLFAEGCGGTAFMRAFL